MTSSNWLLKAQAHFPSLNAGNCKLTSPIDEDYNCIAWAAEDTGRWWWPDSMHQKYWPTEAPRAESVDAFIVAFGLLGYMERTDETMETDKQKVAIFEKDGRPSHAARQLEEGGWTSKLGEFVDITHELAALENGDYGKVAVILARLKS